MDKKKRREVYAAEDHGEYVMDATTDKLVREKIALSETELDDCRVNFRWQKEPLSIIKKVAEHMGVPYQTYMKQVLFRQALQDLERINTAMNPSRSKDKSSSKLPP